MRKLIFFGCLIITEYTVWGKKSPNTLSQFMYHRDAFNYNSSVQTAYNKANSPIKSLRNPYFDSTEYNYQVYYNKDGIIDGSTNPPDSAGIRAWLDDYGKIMKNMRESSREGIYATMGKHPEACKFRYPVSTYLAQSFHHALVGRPLKRNITIENGNYQHYHWFIQNKIAFEQQYQRWRGSNSYFDQTIEISENGTNYKRNMPYWWMMGGKDNFKIVPRRINDRMMMQPYRSMSFPEGGHIQNKHFQKPLRKLRAGMLQPKYLRDQFRLPQCMTPRQIRRQRKGNLPKYFDVSGPVAGDPNWYPQFQLFPNVWDELCTSPTGRGSAVPFNPLGRNKTVNGTNVLQPMRGIKLCTHVNEAGSTVYRADDFTMSYLNATVTKENQFQNHKYKNLLMARDWMTTFGNSITEKGVLRKDGQIQSKKDWNRIDDPRICNIYPDRNFTLANNEVFNPFDECWKRKMGPNGLGLWSADPVEEPEEEEKAGASYIYMHIILFVTVLLL